MSVAGIINVNKLDKKLKINNMNIAINLLGLRYKGVRQKGANVLILEER